MLIGANSPHRPAPQPIRSSRSGPHPRAPGSDLPLYPSFQRNSVSVPGTARAPSERWCRLDNCSCRRLWRCWRHLQNCPANPSTSRIFALLSCCGLIRAGRHGSRQHGGGVRFTAALRQKLLFFQPEWCRGLAAGNILLELVFFGLVRVVWRLRPARVALWVELSCLVR